MVRLTGCHGYFQWLPDWCVIAVFPAPFCTTLPILVNQSDLDWSSDVSSRHGTRLQKWVINMGPMQALVNANLLGWANWTMQPGWMSSWHAISQTKNNTRFVRLVKLLLIKTSLITIVLTYSCHCLVFVWKRHKQKLLMMCTGHVGCQSAPWGIRDRKRCYDVQSRPH